MNTWKRSLPLSLGTLLSLGCGGTQQPAPTQPVATAQPAPPPARPAPPPAPPTTPDAPFRAEEPAAQPTPAFTPPRIEQFALSNRLNVLLVERHELPVVDVQFITRRGADDAPVTKAGLASLVGVLLEAGGTNRRTAAQLSDAYAALGAEHASWVSWDSGGASVKVLAPNLNPALDLLAEVIQHPAFAPDEIERARARRLAALQQELDSPRTVATNVAARVVFGDAYPYGRSLTGNAEAIAHVTRADIAQFYRTHFVPAESALVVVGDVTRAAITPTLENTFGHWRAAAPAAHALAAPPEFTDTARIVLVDRPGAAQSAVTVAHHGVPRNSRDYAALVVMNTILGGMFSSRINLNLREAHAYTYGAGSAFAFRHGPGPFTVNGAIVTASTGAAVGEVFNELSRMRSTDVTDAELAAAKARITESLPSRFETSDQTAGAVDEVFAYGLPLDEYATIATRVNAVTAADVRRVANAYLDPDHARIIVVGDRSVVEPQLRELNRGAIEVRTPLGEREGAMPAAANTTDTHPVPPSTTGGTTRPRTNRSPGEHH